MFHDDRINPRAIGGSLNGLVEAFHRKRPQLHVALAWAQTSQSFPMKLKGAHAKLRRAHEHCNTLDRSIGSCFETHPYTVSVEHPADELYVLRVTEAHDIPDEDWALIIGDCVHNIRCCVDYIAWELAGGDPTDTETQFPIYSTEAGWDKRGVSRVKRMSADAQAFMKRLQPFNSQDPTRDVLTALRILDDADKHKLLTVVAAMPDHIGLEWATPGAPDNPPPEPTINLNVDAVVAHGAILATVVISGPKPDMPDKAEFTPDVAFGESLGFGPRIHIVRGLRTMLETITFLLDKTEQKFFAV